MYEFKVYDKESFKKDVGCQVYRWISKEEMLPKDNLISFIWSAYNGYMDNLKHLVSTGIDIKHNKDEAIYLAAKHGKLDAVKYLASLGCGSKKTVEVLEDTYPLKQIKDLLLQIEFNIENFN